MADSLGDLYMNSRTCSKCFEDVQNQETKSCHHVICEKCNADFINSNPDRDCLLCIGDFELDCSDDEYQNYLKPMKPPIPDRSPRKLPRPPENLCASCERDEPVTAHCEDCKGDICHTCCEQHENMSALRNHILSAIPTSPPLHCRRHSDGYADMVCKTCNGLRVCRGCIQEYHVGHDIDGSAGSVVRYRKSKEQGISSAPQDTYQELINQLGKLKLNVQERGQSLTLSMTEAEKDIEENASRCVHNVVEEAEKTKRDIDRQVLEYAQKISRQKDTLLQRLKKRQNYIQQRSQMIKFELENAEAEAQKLLQSFNRLSTDPDGYTQMQQSKGLREQRLKLTVKLESLQNSYDELTFTYTPSTGTTNLGKIEALRKWNRITDSCVERIRKECDYVPSSMLSDPDNNILFTSYKGSTKAALDLVNTNGNVIHTRKLQDNGQEPVLTPAFGIVVDDGLALMGWETTVFSLKMSTQDKVHSVSVRNVLVPTAKICCIACSHERKEVAIGNDKNRIINLFDFDMKFKSSVTIKEEGPPSFSLAFHGKLILFADGIRTALAVDYNGNTMVQFLPPGYDSKPLAIDSSQGFVYILWKNSSTNEEKYKSIVQCYSMKKHPTPGSPVGVPLTVHEETKFITLTKTSDGDDRLVTGTSDGGIAVYCLQEI